MALLPLAAGYQVCDASGVPVSGAQVRVYEVNTTTLATLYSDAAMTVALSNPVVCNSAGYPSSNGTDETLIFLADGDYDVAYLDADDAELVSFPDVPTVGEEGADITRTLADNTRFKVTGSGGRVLIQVGDASPDNTGGTATFEGWAGTQADEFLFDAALVNTTGRLKENSKTLSSVVHTASTAINGTEVAIALPEWVDGLRAWRITVFDLLISTTTGNLRATLSYDGGANYKTGASDYHSYSAYGTTETAAAATAYMDLAVAAAFETASGKLAHVVFDVLTADSGTNPTVVTGRLDGWNNGATGPTNVRFTSFGLGGYGRATHIKLYDSAGGTLTGKYRIEALYGFGET